MTENGRNVLRSYMARAGHGHRAAAAVIGCTEKTFTKKLNGYDGAEFFVGELIAMRNRYDISREDMNTIVLG